MDFHALCQESANTAIGSMPYRGATILNGQKNFDIIEKCFSKPREVWFIYAGMGSQWTGMARSLMELEVFRTSIENSARILKPLGCDLMKILMEGTDETLKITLNPFVCITSIQVALTDLLRAMGIRPDGIVGHSMGEVGAAYGDGCLTAEEAVLTAYWRGRCISEGKVPPGRMAAVGLTWEEAQAQCPPGVVAACHNAEDSVTISGAADAMLKFMEELKAKNIFVREVQCNNMAYHSHLVNNVHSPLLAAFKKFISPRPRSSKWLPTSLPEDKWDTLGRMSSGDYHANNLINPVLFYEALQKIPPNAIAIEIAPHDLLQSVIKRSLGSDCICVGLQKRNIPDNLEFFFASLGTCYVNGMSMNALKAFPPVQYPVPLNTPRLSDMIAGAWDHSVQWQVPMTEDFEGQVQSSSADTSFSIDVGSDSPDRYLLDHQVDGRELFPACGSLVLAWKTLASLKGKEFDRMPAKLTNVQIHQAMFLRTSGAATVTVSVTPNTGEFQVCENESVLASGFITSPESDALDTDQHTKIGSVLDGRPTTEVLMKEEVYRELILRGYEYGPSFQGIVKASVDGREADILWDGRWISFMDTVLQMVILSRPGDFQMLPIFFQSINIDPRVQLEAPGENKVPETIPGCYDPVLDIAAAGGVEIRGSCTIAASRRLTHSPEIVEEYRFVPYHVPQQGDGLATHAGSIEADLKDYADALLVFARQGLKRWLAEDKGNVIPQRELLTDALALADKSINKSSATKDFSAAKATLDAMLKNENGLGHIKFGLFHALNMAFNEPLQTGFRETLKAKIHDARFGLWDDQLTSAVESADIIKLCIDTAADNMTSHVLNVLEAGALKGAYYRRAIPCALSKFSGKDYRYTVADSFVVEDASEFSVKMLQFDPYKPDDFPPAQQGAYDLLVLKWVLHKQERLDEAMEGLSNFVRPGGFVLVHEFVDRLPALLALEAVADHPMPRTNGDRVLGRYYSEEQWRAFFHRHGFLEVIHRTDGLLSSVFLLKKRVEIISPPIIVYMDDIQCSWLEEVKAKYVDLEDAPEDTRLWLVGKSDCNGMLGFYNCLRLEPGSERVRCVQVTNLKSGSKVPEISADNKEFREMMEKDLAFNVYRDGSWGTYRHLGIMDEERRLMKPTCCTFADSLTAGDPLTLTWVSSPLNINPGSAKETETELCTVYFAGINARDVLLANGRLKRDDLPEGMFYKEGVLGVEFAGRDRDGKRVMGLCAPPALATSARCYRSCLWTVPQHWGLEEAASVPLAYSTAYYALVIQGRIRQGESVLVHSGGSAIGQAAISVALSSGCEVFVSTRSSDESALLRAIFPRLKDRNFCSTDTSFERHIKAETKGRGVDIVLNSMTGELLRASLRLLAKRGRFLDIGVGTKRDDQSAFSTRGRNDTSYHDINLDTLIDAQGPEWLELTSLVQTGIQSGAVKPLKRAVYTMDRLVEVFKAVEEGREAGKVLVKMRDEEAEKITLPPPKTFDAIPRTFFHPSKSYVIVGGLGGFGLELTHWMVGRGARKLVLSSRKGITTGYQTRKIAVLRRLGADVEVAAINVTTQESADALVRIATKMGPLGGLFNLGLNLCDALLVEQTAENYRQTLESKIVTTLLLDGISKEQKYRTSLDHFVTFSSLSAGHGIPGQTNYAWGNSFMDRLCEKRKAEGLPALSIQWASVADVGFVGTKGNNVVIEGKWPQRMYNCLAVTDFFLSQSRPVVSSYVLAEKAKAEVGGEESVIQQVTKAVGKILGLKSVSAVDPDKIFLDLGLDSLMGVEIKQMLERDLEVNISTKEVQTMTFSQLQGLASA